MKTSSSLLKLTRTLRSLTVCLVAVCSTASIAQAQQDPLRPLDRLYDLEPKTRNSPLVATPERAKLEGFTGGASYRYPIKVPPGTGKATPNLELSYSSLSKNGPYGWGWSLNLPRIERSTRFGPPTYDWTEDEFEIDGELLVRDPHTPNRFYRRDYDFSRIIYHPPPVDTWEVTQPDGTVQTFGSTAENARIPVGFTVFAWGLDKVVDPQGNAYKIGYMQTFDGAQVTEIYPERIRYSFNDRAVASGTVLGTRQDWRLVRFYWGDRGGASEDKDLPTSYRSGFKNQISKRLVGISTGIDVTRDGDFPTQPPIGSDLISAGYFFEYAAKTSVNPQNAPFSKLVAIHRLGSDLTAFPRKTQFAYSDPQRGFQPGVPMSGPPGTIASALTQNFLPASKKFWTTKGLYDMNGDGIPDRVETFEDDRRWKVYFGLSRAHGGPGYSDDPVWWRFCNLGGGCQEQVPEGGTLDSGYWGLTLDDQGTEIELVRKTLADLVDMNGDGLLDRVEFLPSGLWVVRLNRAYQGGSIDPAAYEFGSPEIWSGPNLRLEATYPNARAIHHSFVLDRNQLHPNDTRHTLTRLVDVTGDGCPDHATVDVETPGNLWVSVNRACTEGFLGFADPVSRPGGFSYTRRDVGVPAITVHTIANSFNPVSSPGYTGADIADLNGDGIPDFVGTTIVGGSLCLEVSFGSGDSWFEPKTIDCGDGSTDPYGTQGYLQAQLTSGSGPPFSLRTLADINGDGVPDRIGVSGDINGPTVVRFGLGDGTFSSTEIQWSEFADPTRLLIGPRGDGAFLDVDGDGLVDRVVSKCVGDPNTCTFDWTLYPNAGGSGLSPGLLTKVTNELGGETNLTYQSSVNIAGTTDRGETLPASTGPTKNHHWILKSIEVHDGRGSPPISNVVEYAEPRYDHRLRENLGFREIEELDSASTLTETLFHQTIEKRGRIESIATFAGGQRLRVVENTWSNGATQRYPDRSSLPGVFFPFAEWTRTFTFDPLVGGDPMVREIQELYDTATGNLGFRRDGDLSNAYTYDENAENWTLSYLREATETHGSAEAGRTSIDYDADRNVERVEKQFDKNVVSTWTYDAFGNVNTFCDGRCNAEPNGVDTLTVTYDSEYNMFPTLLQNRKNHRRKYSFDPRFGEVSKFIDPNGVLSCFGFDPFGRLLALRRRGNTDSTLEHACPVRLADFSYNNVGMPGSQHTLTRRFTTNQTSLQQRRYFDGLGREYRIDEPAGGSDFFITVKGFGSRGEESCKTLPFRAESASGGCTSYSPRRETVFDALMRPTARQLHRSSGGWRYESVSDYRVIGGELSEYKRILTDGDVPERITETFSNARGQVVRVDETLGGGDVTRFTYDPRGRITQVDGPNIELENGSIDNNVMTLGYDFLGNQTHVRVPGNCAGLKRWSFEYDHNNNVVLSTPPRADDQIRYEYDVLDRIELKDYMSPMEGDIRFAYDTAPFGVGRLASVDSRAVDTSYEYDAAGRVFRKNRQFVSGQTYSTMYLYDRSDRRTITVFPSGGAFGFTYTGALLSSVSDGTPTPLLQNIEYHAGGALKSIDYRNGASSWFGFDPDTYRPNQIETTAGAQMIQDITLTYDRSGALTRYQNVAADADLIQNYTYDALHRLTSVASSGTLEFGSIGYDYDSAGNLTRKGNKDLLYECSSGGPTAVTGVRQGGIRLASYGYDENGAVNLREKSGTTAFWRNPDGRITKVMRQGASSCYGYDERGNRVAKYFFDHGEESAVDRLYVDSEFEADITSGRHYLHAFVGGKRMATIERSGDGSGGGASTTLGYRFYHPDQIGSNTLLTDGTGGIIGRSVYTPYGELARSFPGSSPEITRYGFTGQEYEEESQLNLFGARHYDPYLGRFLSVDPSISSLTGQFIREPGLMNGHAYALNRPATFVDPEGLLPFEPDVIPKDATVAEFTATWEFEEPGPAPGDGESGGSGAGGDAAPGRLRPRATEIGPVSKPASSGPTQPASTANVHIAPSVGEVRGMVSATGMLNDAIGVLSDVASSPATKQITKRVGIVGSAVQIANGVRQGNTPEGRRDVITGAIGAAIPIPFVDSFIADGVYDTGVAIGEKVENQGMTNAPPITAPTFSGF